MFPFNRLFSETINIRYNFSNNESWQILVNDEVRAKSGRDDNSGTIPLTDNGNYTVKFNGVIAAAFGVANVDVGTQSKRFLNSAKQRTIPATTRTETYTVERYDYTLSYVANSQLKTMRLNANYSFQETGIKKQIRNYLDTNNPGVNERFVINRVQYRVTGKLGPYEVTSTRIVNIPKKSENYYDKLPYSFTFQSVRIGPETSPETPPPQTPEIEPLSPSLVISQKYRVIDPLVYGYVQGKKVPSVRYWRVRNLTPSEVSSLIARGYEVSVVDQETPLTPPTVYAASIIERSKILHPDISHAAQTQRPKYRMSWIEQVGDIGRRRHAGRRSVGQTNLIPAAHHVRSSSSRRSMR